MFEIDNSKNLGFNYFKYSQKVFLLYN